MLVNKFKMTSFLSEYLFEINEFPQYGADRDLYTIKDYFFYDSSTKEFGYRNLIVPVSCIINKQAIPTEATIRELINKQVPVLKRGVDGINLKEIWSFEYDN